MAEAQRDDDDDEIFVYMGANQVVPDRVRRARIHRSVKIIPARAFKQRYDLIYVEFHDEIEIIEEEVFCGCLSLRGCIKLLGVKIIKDSAFHGTALTDVEFGDRLETIEDNAFFCTKLKNVRMPSVRTIGKMVFRWCEELSDVECGEDLEAIKEDAFQTCRKFERIALPLKDDMIEDGAFNNCPNLLTVDLVGGIHGTVASLHMESWRNEMKVGIDRINQDLLNVRGGSCLFHQEGSGEKTQAIQQWIRSVIRRLEYYKAVHKVLLKEATTLLELALWKAKIDDENEKESVEGTKAMKIKLDAQCERNNLRITSSAGIIIKNVLPFLELN